MKNSILITVIVMSVLVLAGCTGGQTVNSAGTPYVGGTNGLLISFLENSPPAQVSDGNTFPFDIVVLLENAGESDIPTGKASVTISGLYPGDFRVTPADLTTTNTPATGGIIQGVKKDPAGNKIPGSVAQIEIPVDDAQLSFVRPLTTGNLQLPIQTNVCYTYATHASGRYCLRANPLSNVQGVCEPTGTKELYSSASPMQVVNLVQSYAGADSVNLNFQIIKRGNGNVFRPTDLDSPDIPVCGQTASAQLIDQNIVGVTVSVPTAPAGEVTCYGLGGAGNSGTVRLDSQGNAAVSCKISNSGGVDAVRELNVDLAFDYSEVRTSSIIVQKLS